MADEWCRRKTWTEKDKEQFFARLHRSRTRDNKARYLLIQAGVLFESHGNKAAVAVLELIEIMLRDYAEPFHLVSAYKLRGNCLEKLGDIPGAVENYRQALKAQRDHPVVQTLVHLDFAWLVAMTPLPELYNEALGVLAEIAIRNRSEREFFPANEYRACAARAFIFEGIGDAPESGRWALRAIEVSELKDSGIRYHRRLGLVGTPDSRIHDRLKTLAFPDQSWGGKRVPSFASRVWKRFRGRSG